MALGDSIEVDSGSYSPESLKLRRRLAETMMQQGMNTGPISSPWQGIARMVQAMMGGYQLGELERKEREGQDASTKALVGLLGPVGPSGGETAMPAMAVPAPAQAPRSVQNADGTTSTFIGEVGPSVGPSADIAPYARAIASIETPGSKNPYGELGPVVKSGDRAYGKYQVMGENVPVWTKEILGQSMTPEQFLKSPEAQELVFAAKFGSYVQKYGSPQAAASVWFTGHPDAPNARAHNPDGSPLGITGSEYVEKFSAGLNGAPAPQMGGQPIRVAQAGGMPQMPPMTSAPQLPPQVTPEVRARITALLGNPATRQLGMAMLQQYVVPPKPMTPMEQAELANKQATLTKTQADIVKTQAETAKTASEMPKGPDEVAKQVAGGIEQLRRFPVEFGTEAFERATGPWSATVPASDGLDRGSVLGTNIPISSFGQQIARGFGEAKAALFGGAAPTEVRGRVETAMKNLAAVMKPMIRKPGEGAWSDKDQENLEKQIGDLTTARDVGEYRRRLNDIEENMQKIFQVPVKSSETVIRSDNAPPTAEETITPAERVMSAVDGALPTDAQILAWLDKNVMERLRAKGGTPLSPEEKQEMMIRMMQQAGGY